MPNPSRIAADLRAHGSMKDGELPYMHRTDAWTFAFSRGPEGVCVFSVSARRSTRTEDWRFMGAVVAALQAPEASVRDLEAKVRAEPLRFPLLTTWTEGEPA